MRKPLILFIFIIIFVLLLKSTSSEPYNLSVEEYGIEWAKLGFDPNSLPSNISGGVQSCDACDDRFFNIKGDTLEGNVNAGGYSIINANWINATHTNLSTFEGNLNTSGNVTADYFFGNGSYLHSLNVTLQDALDNQPIIEANKIIFLPKGSSHITWDLTGESYRIILTGAPAPAGFVSAFYVYNESDSDTLFQIGVAGESQDWIGASIGSKDWAPLEDNVYDFGCADCGALGVPLRWKDGYFAGSIKGTGSGESIHMNASSGDVRFGFQGFNVSDNGSLKMTGNINASNISADNFFGSGQYLTGIATNKTSDFSDSFLGLDNGSVCMLNSTNNKGNLYLSHNLTVDTNTLFVDSNLNRVGIGQVDGFDPRAGLSITGDLDIDHTATESDDHALEIMVNAFGFGDVKGILINYITGIISAGEDEDAILINIDESQSTGGSIIGIGIFATEGLAEVYGLEAGVGVHPVVQLSGTFGNMDLANTTIYADVVENFTSFDTQNVTIFGNDNDYVIIGDSVKFEEIEFLLNTEASVNIKPTFEYSTGVSTWTAFSPTDGTSGMTQTGVIAWLDSDIPSWATGLDAKYLIRITRTKNNVVTVPIEGKVQISSATLYKWSKEGNIKVQSINISDGLTVDYLTSCDTIDTDANGTLKCGSDGGGGATHDSTFNASITDNSTIFRLNSTQNKGNADLGGYNITNIQYAIINRTCWTEDCLIYTYYNGSCKIDVGSTSTSYIC